MDIGFPTKYVTEGKAKIRVPCLDTEWENQQQARSRAPVFYNPVMKLNRDSAILAVKVHIENNERYKICEPLAGSGVRGVRLALETDAWKIVLSDLNPSAVKLTEVNIRNNQVTDKIETRLLDANLLLSLHAYPGGRFDYVDIDPYGSPTPFLANAIRATENKGLIALTATDMPPLCGVNKKACIRKYGGASIQSSFCHETALRLLTSALVKQAAIYEIAAKPVFSYYADHYIRLYAMLVNGARRSDKQLQQIGYIAFCPKCLYRCSSKTTVDKCPICDESLQVGGPLWLGDLAESKFCGEMLEKTDGYIESRLIEIIRLVKDEIGYPPWFYTIDEVCSKIGSRSQPTEKVTKKIMEAGHQVSRVHFNNRGIKTDASISELEKIIK